MSATTATAITPRTRVRLYVSDCADKVAGTVLRVYTDAIGTEVADIELSDGSVRPQCTEFLEVTR